MNALPFKFSVLAFASLVWVPPGWAQQQTVVITGNPLGRDTLALPASVLSGDGLAQRRAATLGETLDGLPGVAATAFGPNSSRPVIRGLDGDRVRLLDNGGASVDASSLSFDHASATNPLVAERIEVLRGPAALLYGGSATGGVVNTLDNRIPRLPASGLSGRAEVRLGGAAAERSGAALLEGGEGRWAWHADAYGRKAEDLHVPRFIPLEGGVALPPSRRVRNSAAQGEGAALGGGWVSSQGYLGASVETAGQRYGVTVEPDVFIRMRRERLALAGEWRALSGAVDSVTAQASSTRYRHDEVEGSGDIGTTFRSQGEELRLQARHAPWGPLRGVVGLQTEALNFSALGEEAFVPGTRTRSSAMFVLEEWNAGPAVLGLGARAEQAKVASLGDPAGGEPRFGSPRQRRFSPTSAAFSARAGGNEGWQASLGLGHTERAPAYYELYANGVHVATSTFERGDDSLPTESSRHAELGLAWKQGPHHVKASLFQTRFSRFISLDATGTRLTLPGAQGEPDTALPEFAFRAIRARLSGAELEARTRLLSAGAARAYAVDLSLGLDTVRGSNRDKAEPLPRLAPLRLRAALQAEAAGWQAGVGLRYSARQTRVPATDRPTPGAVLLDLWAGGSLPLGGDQRWFARLSNLTDKLAFNASSIDTIRGLAPQAGRAFSAGWRGRF